MLVLAALGLAYPNLGAVVSNVILLGGFTLLRSGLRRLNGQPPPSYGLSAALIVALAAWMSYASLGGTYSGRYGRIVIFSAYLTVLATLIAFDQWRARSSLARGPRLFAAAAFAVTAAANALRGVWVVIDPATQIGGFPSDFETVFRLVMILSSFAVTVGAVLTISGRLLERLDAQASSDPLTGVLNRRGFEAVARPALARAAREAWPIALLVMDLDRFKAINDTYGHAVGDRVLSEFAVVANRCLRAQDVLARFGGEEFVALLGESGLTGAREVAERLRKAWAEHEMRDGETVLRNTVSIGIAAVEPETALPIVDAHRRADEALYRAKQGGRDRVELEVV
jgi:diguanylate cyclase (GGDEF)-like protein